VHSFASPRVVTHLGRGLAGFGALAVAWYLWPSVGWLAAVPAAAGVVSLRGCPMCWTIGLVQTLSRQRLRRVCTDDGCALRAAGPARPGAGTVRR
jgi:hypothetical protein